MTATTGTPGFLPRTDLDRLLDLLREGGRTVIGPVVRDGAIAYDEIAPPPTCQRAGRTSRLPAVTGCANRPVPGVRLHRRPARLEAADPASSGHDRFSGPEDGSDVRFEAAPRAAPSPSSASVPARSPRCSSRTGSSPAGLRGRRLPRPPGGRLVVAVQCTRAGITCFCASMGTGPEVTAGADLVLTELDDGFVVDAGCRGPVAASAAAGPAPTRTEPPPRGVAPARAPWPARVSRPRACRAPDGPARHPRWAEVAERCLACANCTMVCPTCFCTSVGTVSDLDGVVNRVERRWDSCFDGDFAKVAGGDFRPRRQDRYRQWLTHKFATWQEQFGSFGCVGCGRCVTWCPVGIDVREELAAIAPPYETTPPPMARVPTHEASRPARPCRPAQHAPTARPRRPRSARGRRPRTRRCC